MRLRLSTNDVFRVSESSDTNSAVFSRLAEVYAEEKGCGRWRSAWRGFGEALGGLERDRPDEPDRIKTRRNNPVVRVERRVKIGTARRLKDALLESEDSETLNTSFVERLNLTIRQLSAHLRRRSPCHARCEDQLREHVELLRCHYNFVRPHRALKFGRETRTPAMQAGLVSKLFTWRDIFTARDLSPRLVALVRVSVTVEPTESDTAALPTFSSPLAQRKAA